MAPTTNGLTNGGATAHYTFTYDDSLSAPLNPTGPEPARTNGVIAACESDFNQMSGWFGGIALDVPTPIPVNVTQNGGGAGWNLSNGNLTITINPDTRGSSHVRYLLVSEMVEQFMRAQEAQRADNWFGTGTEGSNGEGLSRFLAAQSLALNGLGNPPTDFANSNLWLQTSRQDYVNTNPPGASTDDGPDAITGCALLFIYYLFNQLGYSVEAIVGAGAPTLAGVYKNLTGDSADPFPAFIRLLNIYYPGTATITGANLDNPYPLREEQQHAFYRGGDGSIDHIFWHPTNQFYWDQWTQRSGAPPAAGDPATMVWPNQQHAFYRGNDGSINHIFWDSPSNGLYWDSWTQKTGAPPAAGDPATMVWPNQQHVFYRGTDGSINHIFWDSPSNGLYWDSWTQKTGAPLAAGDPATMVWPNQQHVFYRGTDGSINHIFWDSPSNGLYWDSWTQRTGAPPAAGDPASMIWPNQQHVFYRGTDGSINHIFWDSPSNNLYWDQWTQRTGAPPAAGDPATMLWPNQQHVFYRAADGSINHIFWDSPSNGLYWDSWTQRTGAPPAAGDPATMVTTLLRKQPNQQHVLYRGIDGSINHIFWDSPTNQLLFDQWTQQSGAPPASGDPATMAWNLLSDQT